MDLFSAVMLIFSFIFLRFMLFLVDETERMEIETKRKNRKKPLRETPYTEVREIERSAERAALSAAHSEEEEIDG